MADAPVEFDQSKFFDQSNPLLNAVLQNVASFAGDLSGGLGTLVEFLNLTKIYLQAIADPIALILIPSFLGLFYGLITLTASKLKLKKKSYQIKLKNLVFN